LLSPGLCGQLACILEVSAGKPGNVTLLEEFEDASALDFLLAAAAIGEALDRAPAEGVGRAVLRGVERTRALVGGNPNLGLLLLLAPLAAAAGRTGGPVRRAEVIEVLKRLRPADASRVYQAIRLAEPGGLGTAAEEDVRRGPPSRPLCEAMALAADRDLVARQYAGGFGEVFSDGLASLESDLAAGFPLEIAIVRCHLQFMARYPDSLIARKCGKEAAKEAAVRARAVLGLGWPRRRADRALALLDRWLRAEGHRRNPGTSADLVGASLFLAIRNGIIPLPITKSLFR